MVHSRKSSVKVLAAAVLLSGLAGVAGAGQDAELQQSVARLGELNGIALACKQNALATRLREIMIETAPKQRDVGEYFENATNESFLAFGQSGDDCPDGKTLAGQIEHARQALNRVMGIQS